MIQLVLPDGNKKEFKAGVSLYEVAQAIGPGLAKAAVGALVDGELHDLRERVYKNCAINIITTSSPQGREILCHTTAHIMAQAVKNLFHAVKLGIGPAITDGFYYDFDLPRRLSSSDLEKISEEMRRIIADDLSIERWEKSREEAKEIMQERGEELKLELIDELDTETVTFYQQGDFIDLCRGPHLPATSYVNPNAFKLTSVAGAYWKGDESRPMLQRIYGTVWNKKTELDTHLERLAEIERRDHRKLIKELDLVSFNDEGGAGLAYWHPKGGRMRVLIEDYWRKLHYEGGYEIIFTPHIGRAQLWETSGHLDFYRDGMYSPMEIEGQDYYIKPMNCPFHVMIYNSRTRSYRELPLRWAELGTVYRYERSGTLHGMLRVRGFTQDDAHIICTPEQIDEEILRVLEFSLNLLRGFGFTKFKIELSVRNPKTPEKYAGEDLMWEEAEASLVKALEAKNFSYHRMEGEAVFYGPKIDIKIEDGLGRTWQCTTIQFDFNIPGRFDMMYIGEDGKEHRPYMVHRALLGSIERFYALLVEHYNGAFPVWLSPLQVVVLPVSQDNSGYAQSIAQQLRAVGIRVEARTERGRTINYLIRQAQLEKIPYMLVVGKREEEQGTVAVRLRTEEDLGPCRLDQFIELITEKIARKELI